MRFLRELLWRLMEPRVQAVVTERLLQFEDALVRREQIRRSFPPEPTPEAFDVARRLLLAWLDGQAKS